MAITHHAGTVRVGGQRGARDNTFLVTHPMTDQRCLTSVITRRSVLTGGHRGPPILQYTTIVRLFFPKGVGKNTTVS
jgi:hypothetical protein